MAVVSDEIFEAVKNFLHITYTVEQSTDNRLRNEISAGIEFIRKYCDPEADCAPGSRFGALLQEYVLRAESGAVDSFKVDFANDITSERIGIDVEAYAKAMGYGDGD